MKRLEPVEMQHRRCEKCRDGLRELARIHLEIDLPTRRVGADEPDWVFRPRKLCLHALAITECTVNPDGVLVMTTELRAAYEQMDAVWKCLPDEFRFDADGTWWAEEAKDGLAACTHPMAFSLTMPLAWRGFSDADPPESYLRIASWLGRLGCGYGLALGHLAQVLSADGNIESRLAAALSDMR